MAKLLREFIGLDYDAKVIKELKETNQPIILSGILQRADAKNQNGRIYPRAILEREIGNYKKAVAESRAVGQADHPDSSVVELKNVSHIVRDLWWQGNDVMGKIEILNTPAGNIIESLMSSGVRLGISSRGVGGTTKLDDGTDVVDESFTLICWDIVSDPSTQGAWLFKEGKEISMQEVMQHMNKRDRINRIANEILGKL